MVLSLEGAVTNPIVLAVRGCGGGVGVEGVLEGVWVGEEGWRGWGVGVVTVCN